MVAVHASAKKFMPCSRMTLLPFGVPIGATSM